VYKTKPVVINGNEVCFSLSSFELTRKPDLPHHDKTGHKTMEAARMAKTANQLSRGGGRPPTRPEQDRRTGAYLGLTLDRETEQLLEAAAERQGVSKAEVARSALKEAVQPPKAYGAQGEMMLRLLGDLMRTAVINSGVVGDWLNDPTAFKTAFGEMIAFLQSFPRPDGVPAGKLETPPQQRADRLLWILGDLDAIEISPEWAASVRRDLGAATVSRLVERRQREFADALAVIEENARRIEESKG
jgi:hypothetical protein